MFKTIVIAALGFAAVSAQFLDERNLQNGTTTVTPVAFTAAPAVSATGVETGCNTAGFAIATNTRTGTAVAATVPANLCVPTDFIGSSITIAGSTYAFTKIASNVVAVNRTVCTSDDACAIGQCCADITLTAGLTTANGTATRKFCTAGAAATLYSSTYVAASWLANYGATVRSAVCTPKAAPAESFGSYIKASVMMVVAVLSVALF
jgi:hypothetical protein